MHIKIFFILIIFFLVPAKLLADSQGPNSPMSGMTCPASVQCSGDDPSVCLFYDYGFTISGTVDSILGMFIYSNNDGDNSQIYLYNGSYLETIGQTLPFSTALDTFAVNLNISGIGLTPEIINSSSFGVSVQADPVYPDIIMVCIQMTAYFSPPLSADQSVRRRIVNAIEEEEEQ